MALREEHQKVVIEILQKNRTKKSCNKCYDRGYTGFRSDKSIIPCENCVDITKCKTEWSEYLTNNKDTDLKENFSNFFEDGNNNKKIMENIDIDFKGKIGKIDKYKRKTLLDTNNILSSHHNFEKDKEKSIKESNVILLKVITKKRDTADKLRETGKFNRAIVEYKQLWNHMDSYEDLWDNSNNEDIVFNYGICYYKKGDFDNAIKVFQEVSEKFQNNEIIKKYYAWSLYRRYINIYRIATKDNVDEALLACKRILELSIQYDNSKNYRSTCVRTLSILGLLKHLCSSEFYEPHLILEWSEKLDIKLLSVEQLKELEEYRNFATEQICFKPIKESRKINTKTFQQQEVIEIKMSKNIDKELFLANRKIEDTMLELNEWIKICEQKENEIIKLKKENYDFKQALDELHLKLNRKEAKNVSIDQKTLLLINQKINRPFKFCILGFIKQEKNIIFNKCKDFFFNELGWHDNEWYVDFHDIDKTTSDLLKRFEKKRRNEFDLLIIGWIDRHYKGGVENIYTTLRQNKEKYITFDSIDFTSMNNVIDVLKSYFQSIVNDSKL